MSNQFVTNGNVKHSEAFEAGAYFERVRIWEGIENLYKKSHDTRTPLYQETIYNELKDLLWPVYPARRFRDIANGE